MSVIEDSVEGKMKVRGLPEDFCFTSSRELILALAKYLVPYLSTSDITGLTVGSTPPSAANSKTAIWIRFDKAWNFVGIYAFQNGSWKPLYNIPPGQVIWMTGNSAQVPDGFLLIDTQNPNVAPDVIAAIMPLYRPSGNGPYNYFAVTYVGY